MKEPGAEAHGGNYEDFANQAAQTRQVWQVSDVQVREEKTQNTEAMQEDITLEFYYKSCTYKSKITGIEVPISIKKVFKQTIGIDKRTSVFIISSNNVIYDYEELTNFSI
jgi:hypothetical protein